MKSEKYIKENLNEAFDEIAPDILGSILQTKREEEKSLDYDLRNDSLFSDEVKIKNKIWKPVGAIVFILLFMVMSKIMFVPEITPVETKAACSITLDVNPSIDIEMDELGNVVEVFSNNKDGNKIVNKVNDQMETGDSVVQVVNLIVKELKESGYLKKDTAAILVSADSKQDGSDKNLKRVRKALNQYKKENNSGFVTIYQEYELNKKINKIASENGVSPAKAAYCVKVSEKTNIKVDKLCKESITKITRTVMKEKVDLEGEIQIIESVEIIEDDLEEVVETETTEERESTIEDESQSETESQEIESETESQTEEMTEIGTEENTIEHITEMEQMIESNAH